MNLTPNHKGVAASAGLLVIATVSAVSVIYDHLYHPVPAPSPRQHIGIVGYPLDARIGGALLEAKSSRIDWLLNYAHVMEGVSVKTPAATIEAVSGTMLPAKECLLLEGATLKGAHLAGKIGTLVIKDRRIVFEDLQATGTIAPLRVRSFEAGRIFLPKTVLEREGAGLASIVDAVSARAHEEQHADREITFGFKKLELVLTILFQRAYISHGHARLSDGSAVGFRSGIYSARHRKLYLQKAAVETQRGQLRAEKAEIRMKTGRLILIPPIERIQDGRTDTIGKSVVVDLK